MMTKEQVVVNSDPWNWIIMKGFGKQSRICEEEFHLSRDSITVHYPMKASNEDIAYAEKHFALIIEKMRAWSTMPDLDEPPLPTDKPTDAKREV
jgi:hypothetical protein